MTTLDQPKIFKVPYPWKTPASKYPLVKNGSVEIKKTTYPPAFYHMEGVDGFDYFRVRKSIPITTLWIDGTEWMLDDPLHWIGMQRLAQASKGRVLVAGLGLGLVLHALKENKQVTEVDVVERNIDVKNVIWPLIKADIRFSFHLDDFYHWQRRNGQKEIYDTVILDLWVLGQDSTKAERLHVAGEIKGSVLESETISPGARVFVWGVKNLELNPAVGRRSS